MPFRLVVNGTPFKKVFATPKEIHDFFAMGMFEDPSVVEDPTVMSALGRVGISSIMPLKKSKVPPAKLSDEVMVTSSLGGRRKTARRTRKTRKNTK